MSDVDLAVIGGSGLYGLAGLKNIEEVSIKTPFGDPSGTILIGELHGSRLAFLARHGLGHIYSPSEVPYRANIFALKKLGIKYIISISACGSLRDDYEPGHLVIPNQLVDFTKGKREYSFFGDGIVAHVGVADPFSPEFSQILADVVETLGMPVHRGGTFITVEGPRFSTRGESNLYRQWGMSIIGMTTSPEAYLAAEAEIAYACLAHVTDYDVWHETEEPVSVEMVKQSMVTTDVLEKIISSLAQQRSIWSGQFVAHSGMRDAFISDWKLVPEERKADLAPLIFKYMPA